FELRQIAVIELVTVPMAFGDRARAVDLMRQRAFLELAVLRSQPHRPTQLGSRAALLSPAGGILPFGNQGDHGMGRLWPELGRVSTGETRHVTRELDDGDLEPQADAEIRHLLLARILHGLNLALDPAFAETARHQD